SKRLTFLKRLYKGATLEDLPTSSASPQPLRLAGYDDGIRVDSVFSRRTSGAAGPRSSARTSRNNCSNSCGRVNPGNHRRSSTFSTKSSTLSTIQLTSEDSSKSSVSHVRFHEHSVPLNLRTPRGYSENASKTRSTKIPMSHTINKTVMTGKAGWLTTIFVRMVELSSDSSIHLIHSRGTTHSGCTTSMVLTSPDRWFVVTNQRSASTRSTARAW